MNSKLKKTLNIIVDVIIVLFVVFALVLTILAFTANDSHEGVPSIGNVCVLSVQSPSMEPTINEGDMIIGLKISREEAKDLHVDDVITFYADLDGLGKKLNTHRIVSVDTSTQGFTKYYTKGDNNEFNDSYTTLDTDVICVWRGFRLPGFGSFIDFTQSPLGFFLIIILPLIVFFGFEVFNFVRTLVKLNNNGKRKITEADEEEIKRRAVEEYLRQQKALAEENNSDESNHDSKNE